MWASAKEKGYEQQQPPPAPQFKPAWQQYDYDGKSNRPGPSGMQKGYPPPPPLGSYSYSPTEKLKGYPYSESHQPESGYPGYVYQPLPPQVEGAYLGWKLPYDENSNLPAYVVSAEFDAERSWRQLLQSRGLPYTPYKVKTYDDRINNTMDYHESYVDGLFQKISSSSSSASSSTFVYPPPPPLKEKRPLRVLSESEDEDDALYEVMYGRKPRQLDDELRKDKKYKSLNDIIYADEVSKKKQLNLIENEHRRSYLEFKRVAKGTFMDAFF